MLKLLIDPLEFVLSSISVRRPNNVLIIGYHEQLRLPQDYSTTFSDTDRFLLGWHLPNCILGYDECEICPN